MKKSIIAFAIILIITLTSSAQEYETVTIGDQTWMKKNLNIDALGSVCYGNDSLNCEKYGRLYFWQSAIDVCPAGFRLPTDADWTKLTEYVGGADSAGIALKEGGSSGFNAMLGGNYHPELDMFSYKGEKGYYWTASSFSFHTSWIRSFGLGQKNVNRTTIGKSFYFSIRCIKID
jgi:uncharacterized protein (TIGR02145 family)